MEAYNPLGAPLFFYPACILFQYILNNMFVTIIIEVYNNIRQKKQRQSEAIA